MNHDVVPTRPRRMRSPPPPSAAVSRPGHDSARPGDTTTTNERDDPPIPLLKSTAASIFVPLTTDLAAPAAAPASSSDSRVARLNLLLADHDAHALHVRANIRALVRRECVRLLREAAADEARLAAAPSRPEHAQPSALAPADRAVLISNMEASPDALTPEVVPLPDFSKSRPPANPREWVVKELMAAVSRALSELKGFDAHVARNRAFYHQALKRETERAAQ